MIVNPSGKIDFIEKWFSGQDLSKGQATQLRIIQTSLQLFSQKGFSNVTLKTIAEASFTSHPLILKYFGTKEELLAYVRVFVSRSNHTWVDSKVSQDLSVRDSLIAHAYENLRWAFEKPNEGKIILLTHYYNSLSTLPDNPSARARSLGTDRVHQYFQRAKKEGFIAADQSPKLLSEMLQEFLIGLGVALLTGSELHKKKMSPNFKRKIEIFVDSLLVDQ